MKRCRLFSLPKSKSLIETDAGQKFAKLYMTLRVHGISDSKRQYFVYAYGPNVCSVMFLSTSLKTHIVIHVFVKQILPQFSRVAGSQLQDIQTMNIIPQSWVVKVLGQLYHSVGGADSTWRAALSLGRWRSIYHTVMNLLSLSFSVT